MQFEISVVIPVYNAGKSLSELQSRIDRALSGRYRYEVIYVNDASSDNSLSVLREIERRYAEVRVLNLEKNRGQHESVILGMKHAAGELIANIDDDLQHDPAYIPTLADMLQSGRLDIVYAVPEQGAEFGSRMRDMLFRYLFNLDKKIRVSSFRVYTRELAQSILSSLKPYNYFSALVFQNPVKARTVFLPFDRRKHGKSNYSVFMRLSVFMKILVYYGPWRRKI